MELEVLGEIIVIGPRCKGGLTGSRTAGQLGRIAVEAAIATVHKKCWHLGLPLFVPAAKAEAYLPTYAVPEWESVVVLTAASFVDNIVCVSATAKNATVIAESIEAELLKTWKQKIKPESREIVVARGGA